VHADATQQTCPAFDSAWATWNPFMSDLAKREGTLACPRCKAPMKDVVRIAPAQSDPGLIAYECPSCGYVTRVLIDRQPTTSESNE
jgi:RNase P subunit RPR2